MPGVAAKRSRRLPAPERELQILQAATRVFARSNYRLAGTADIAREAGIAEPTIYKYFPSKKDLFIRILERVGRRILERWDQAAGLESGDALSALGRLGAIYLQGLRTHSDEPKLQFQALAEADDPDIARQLRENHAAYVRFFGRLLERGRREGVVRGDLDLQAAGWLLNGIGFTLTLVRLLGLDREVGGRRLGETMLAGCLDWLAGSRERQPSMDGGQGGPRCPST